MSPANDSRGPSGLAHRSDPASSPSYGSPASTTPGTMKCVYPGGQPAQTASASRPGRRITAPFQGQAPSTGTAQLPSQLPSQSIAQSGMAQHARSSPGMSQPAGTGRAPGRPPPGFGSKLGYPDASTCPSLAAKQHMMSQTAGPHTQPNHAGNAYQAALHALTDRQPAATATQTMLDRQPQTPAITVDSASTADLDKHRVAASVPYYLPAQQVPSHNT